MLPTTLLRKKLCGYRHMPDDMREELHLHIGQFLGAVTFETPDRLDLTEEMKILIAAQAGLLLVGGVGDFCLGMLGKTLIKGSCLPKIIGIYND